MRVLVSGPRGFVGARVMDQLIRDGFDAVPSPSLRNCSEDDVKSMICRAEPDVIVHTAAISDIGTCEQNPELSYRANVELPLWIAKSGVKTLFFSTDQVYSGCESDGPYIEDETMPANTYARHKLEMEQRVLEVNPESVLLRATWMYDMPMYGVPNRGNFLMNMLRQKSCAFSSTQRRGVTYVREVAGWLPQAIHLPGGIYNYGSENDLTMLETALWLKNELQLDIELSDAGRRHHLWMNTDKLKASGICFNSTVDGLRQCMEDYQLKSFN